MTAPLCFLDCETDGVHPDRKVWEVAAIRREPDGEERTFHAFVHIDLATADPFGLRVGRFYERHPQGRWLAGLTDDDPGEARTRFTSRPADLLHSPGWVAQQIARITHGAHIVGAVPSFDAEVLARLLRDHQLTPAWHYHLVDVEALAAGYIARDANPLISPFSEPPWSSSALSSVLGVPEAPEEKHTALGDARWAQRVYDAVMGTGALVPA